MHDQLNVVFNYVIADISDSALPIVKTESQISLSVVSTSKNYVTDALNDNSSYPKCNYD